MRFSPVLHAALPLATLILLATSAYHVATGLGRRALSVRVVGEARPRLCRVGDFANPEKLLEAYGLLRTASELEVKLTRNGAPMQIGVHVR